MNVLILGNGFDIAHGLPTRYTDFLKYCRDYDSSQNPVSENDELNAEFSEMIKNNVWLNYFLKTTLDFDSESTWIDFEKEILKVVQGFCPSVWLRQHSMFASPNNSLTPDEFERGSLKDFRNFISFDGFLNKSSDYPKYDVDGLYKELRRFTRAFEIYCYSIIGERCGITHRYRLNTALLSDKMKDGCPRTYIVSFNYTRTFNKFYDVPADIMYNNYSYVYPHGEACADVTLESAYDGLVTGGLVLGTQSFDHSNNDFAIPVDFNVFQKHNQQHRYSTLADFQQLLLELRKSENLAENVNIFVIGHSLDSSDHAKLRHLFNENKNAKITVFYHDEETFQQYINNITEILGESDVAVRVRFYHQNNQTNGLLLPFRIFEDGRESCDVIDNATAKETIEEILTTYFSDGEVSDFLDELSKPVKIESVEVQSINKVELYETQQINVRGTSLINVEFSMGSDGELQWEPRKVSRVPFSTDFELLLVPDNAEGGLGYENYILEDVKWKRTSLVSSGKESYG